MKSALLAAALSLAWTPAAFEARAAGAPFIVSGPPCGSQGDLFFCITLRPSRPFDDTIGGYQPTFPSAGTALVTWQGSVFCSVTDMDADGSPANSAIEYYVHMKLTEGAAFEDINGPGTASVGERLNVRATTNNVTAARTLLVPVTLTKAFPVRKGTGTYRVVVRPDFRSYGPGSFCNVNGGATTVQFVPR